MPEKIFYLPLDTSTKNPRVFREGAAMASVHVERLDHLGLIACMIKDLDLISMIDARLVPDEQEEITPGEAVAGMILNGLGFAHRPLSLALVPCNVIRLTSTIFLDVMAGESQDPPTRNILVIWEGTHDINADTMRVLWL
jgi:Domain of unknown function (DUF4277)